MDDIELGVTPAMLQGLSCDTNSGLNPTKAALAVAMATEMGRLDPLKDLKVQGNETVVAPPGLARCSQRGYGDCTNTQAILSLQNPIVNAYLPTSEINAVAYREDLRASFDRQRNHEADLHRNAPQRAPGEHRLEPLGTTDNGACGIHYDFSVSGPKADNVGERLIYFGGAANPFIDFRASPGRISIDPSGTMNGGGSTGGSLYVVCTTTNMSLRDKACLCDGRQGKLKVAPWNFQMLYCAT